MGRSAAALSEKLAAGGGARCVGAFDQGAQRIIPHLELIAVFGEDRNAGWERYKSLHHADKSREYYLLHTDREMLDIGLIDPFFRVVTA